MTSSKLRIVFLVGRLDANTRNAVARTGAIPGVEIAAVLKDSGVSGARGRLRNLRRNIRREGWTYPYYRFLSALRGILEQCADRIIPASEVDRLLDAAFPDRTVEALSRSQGFPIVAVNNLNSEESIAKVRKCNADLGVVLGTRVLKRTVFSVPPMGCINLHKGKVPEFRGTQPGFWELYHDCDSAGVTVHFVDDGLDTGDVLGEATVPIHAKETPESLKTKLDAAGTQLLAEVMEQIVEGREQRRPQPASSHAARTRPTRKETEQLARKLPHWRRLGDLRQIAKLSLWLVLYHGGIYNLARWIHRHRSRGAILLYHRVNDVSIDVLTTSTRRFAEHMVTIRRFYYPMATGELVKRVAERAAIPATSVAVHFDDCYQDVCHCAAPLLSAARIPGTAFISSGFIDTDRAFQHDLDKYPHRFPNLAREDVVMLPDLGVQVAAHTVNHCDLGRVSLEQAAVEVTGSRRHLEQLTGRPVLLFSFPFGKVTNIREEVRGLIAEAGYQALFSAHGGFVNEATDLFDIPRFGVSSDHSPLALLMEIEGITVKALADWLRNSVRTKK